MYFGKIFLKEIIILVKKHLRQQRNKIEELGMLSYFDIMRDIFRRL